jgi:hypothetical protein
VTRTSLVLLLSLALAPALALAPSARADGPQGDKPSCTANCHGEEAVALRASVHRDALTCTDCHGGDASAMRDKEASHAAAKGFVGKPARDKVPALCGDCHADVARMKPFGLPTDQLTLYKTSNHGRALFERGDATVAVCTDCHGVHGILAHTDPRAPVAAVNQPATCGKCHSDAKRMADHGLPSDTSDRFVRSVHGKALLVERTRGAPSCADCHGSHGATPPGVEDVVQVCANCHTNTGEEYRKSPHFASKEMACAACHAEEAKKDASYRRSGCTACHDDHEIVPPGDWMYQGNKVGTCDHCHRQADKAAAMKTLIATHRERLRQAMQETERQIADAKARGLFLDAEKVYLRESERIFVSVRPLMHSMDGPAIQKHLDGGVARQDRTREMIAKKGNVIRDHIIISSAVALLLLLMAALLGVKLEALRRLS